MKIRYSILLLVVSAGLAGPALAREGGISVLDAWYGEGRRSCDARGAVASRCEGRAACEFEASNRLCGDPAKGTPKTLTVDYSCGGRSRNLHVPEGELVRLACGSGHARGPVLEIPQAPVQRCRNRQDCRPLGQRPDQVFVAEAVYGARGRYCDATAPMQSVCDGRGRCQVRAGNHLCGDPARKVPKQLEIDYFCNGQHRTATVPEDRIVGLSCP